MAFEYFKYNTGYTNTLVARSNISFAPLFPPYKEIYYDILIPETQPLYLYRESGNTIIPNTQEDVDAYLNSSGVTLPPTPDGNVTYDEYTGTTYELNQKINAISGITSNGITGATNGLCRNGYDVKLGGELTQYTSIDSGTYNLTLNPNVLSLYSKGCMEIMDSNGIGLCIASYGTGESSLFLSGGSGLYKDTRISPKGIEYAGDYSATYSNRSLVDKSFVTGITSTLLPKSTFSTFTGITLPTNYYNKIQINYYTGTTAVNQFASKANAITGATNLGVGNGILYTSVNGNKIQLKSLSGGTNITITCNDNYIGISATGGGINWSGNTINGVGTYVSSSCIRSNPNLTFNGTALSVVGNINASTYICSPIITGSTRICSPIVCGTSCIQSPTACVNTCLCSTGTASFTGAVTAASTLNVSGATKLSSVKNRQVVFGHHTTCQLTGTTGMVFNPSTSTLCANYLQLTGPNSYLYIDTTTKKTNASTTCARYLGLTGTSMPAGRYKLDYFGTFGTTGSNGETLVKFTVDNNIVGGKETYFRMSIAAAKQTASTSRDLTLTAGTHCFDIWYRARAHTACGDYGMIRVIRIC